MKKQYTCGDKIIQSKNVKLEETQAPKILENGIPSKVLGDVSGCSDNALLEKLADLEHQQWCEWSKAIASEEDISDERIERWETKMWQPFNMLSDEVKEYDRKWARKVLEVIKKNE